MLQMTKPSAAETEESMFIYTAKVTKGKLAALILGVIAVIAAIAAMISAAGGDTSETAKLENGAKTVSFKNIKTNDDRVAFLTSFGWDVESTPLAIEEVTIPKEFDDPYSSYNELQKYQDCDLTKYKGKTVKRYTYAVRNHPTGEQGVCANLLVYKNRIIGGDVCSSNFEGFMHGFEKPRT